MSEIWYESVGRYDHTLFWIRWLCQVFLYCTLLLLWALYPTINGVNISGCRGAEPENIPSAWKKLYLNWGRYVDMRRSSEFNSEYLHIWTYLLEFTSNFIQKLGLLSGSMPLWPILFLLISICCNMSNIMKVFDRTCFRKGGCVERLWQFLQSEKTEFFLNCRLIPLIYLQTTK